jgi:phospholipid/cholesterol/gamma-HCH transport system ATP-binding protein
MKLHAVGLRGGAADAGRALRRHGAARGAGPHDRPRPMLLMYDEPFTGLDPISLGVIGQLIRRLNDALGASSVIVTHDIQESLQIVDYIYFISEGRVVAEGTPDEIRHTKDPFVHQFVHAEADGPVPFHYPAGDYARP